MLEQKYRLLFITKINTHVWGVHILTVLQMLMYKQVFRVQLMKITHPGNPWWLRWKRICLQCRRLGFNPWVGKIPWRKEWQPVWVFLPWRIPWTEEPDGLQSRRSRESDTTEWLTLSLFTLLQKPLILICSQIYSRRN